MKKFIKSHFRIIIILTIWLIYFLAVIQKIIYINLPAVKTDKYNNIFNAREIIYTNKNYECVNSYYYKSANKSSNVAEFKCKDSDDDNHNIKVYGNYNIGDSLKLETAKVIIPELSKNNGYTKHQYINTELLSINNFKNDIKDKISDYIWSEIKLEATFQTIYIILFAFLVSFLVGFYIWIRRLNYGL